MKQEKNNKAAQVISDRNVMESRICYAIAGELEKASPELSSKVYEIMSDVFLHMVAIIEKTCTKNVKGYTPRPLEIVHALLTQTLTEAPEFYKLNYPEIYDGQHLREKRDERIKRETGKEAQA